MMVLGEKDGKLWWHRLKPDLTLEPFTVEEQQAWQDSKNERRDNIWADILTKHFNPSQATD